MSGVATAAVLIGAAISAYSMYSAGQNQSKVSSANADVARQNAAIENQNAIVAENQGADKAAQKIQQGRSANATLRASAGSNGLVADTGTLGELQDQNTSTSEFNALTSRNDAARQAWGYQVQGSNFTNQANIDDFSASTEKTDSYLNSGATLITGLGNASSSYLKYSGGKK